MPVTEQTYHRIALDDPENRWELHGGELREKPSMSFQHNHVSVYLGQQLLQQLDPAEFYVRINVGHVRRGEDTYFIPDVFVFPVSYVGPERDRPDVLEVYDQPLPLVVEVWSPSTGGYDIDAKLPEYQRRGDLEIWRIHPFDRLLTAWQRQSNGTYEEVTFDGGVVKPVALPNVTVDLDALFA